MGKVVSRPQEYQHELPTHMRKRPVDAHLDGGVVVHQIRTRMAMEEPPRGTLLPEHRIHLVVTVARLRLGTPRHAHLTHTRMVEKHRLGTPLHGRPIRIKTAVKPLRHGLLTHMGTMIPQTGLTMAAEHLVGAEDGGVVLRIVITHGATRRLRGQLTQVTPHG